MSLFLDVQSASESIHVYNLSALQVCMQETIWRGLCRKIIKNQHACRLGSVIAIINSAIVNSVIAIVSMTRPLHCVVAKLSRQHHRHHQHHLVTWHILSRPAIRLRGSSPIRLGGSKSTPIDGPTQARFYLQCRPQLEVSSCHHNVMGHFTKPAKSFS
jgi:hypothetical protein